MIDGDQLDIYRMLLDLKEIDPSDEEKKKNPFAKSVWPELPATLTRLHERFSMYFKRAYNRDVERQHLPMLAAVAVELDAMASKSIQKPETNRKVA